MILTTARLTLRPMIRADAPALFAILGDGYAMRFWHRPPLPRLATVEAQMEDELAAMAAGTCLYWTVLEDGDAIGSIDLSGIADGAASTGFAFRRDRWGRGLAREAMAAVITQAFGPLGLNHLNARVRADNAGAKNLLQALGFQAQAEPDSPDFIGYALNRSGTANGKD
jgi:RimJ/RimL family protein N-acetyltransferase